MVRLQLRQAGDPPCLPCSHFDTPDANQRINWQLSILTRSSIFIRLATVIFLGAVLGGVPQSLYLRGVMHLTVSNNATLQIIGGVSGLFVQVIMIKPMLDYLGERATTVIGECSNGRLGL